MTPQKFIVFADNGADELGRRSFTLFWLDVGGIFRPETYFDGKPVGHRRGQCFKTQPERFLKDGVEVLPSENEAERRMTVLHEEMIHASDAS